MLALSCSVAQLCPTLCDLKDCSMPGFPVLHCLPEFAQTHVSWVSGLQHQSFQWIFSPLGLTGLISLLSKGLKILLQHHSLKMWIHSAQPSLWSNSHIHTWLLENHSFALLAKWCLCFLIHCLGLHSFSSKEQHLFNFMAAFTVILEPKKIKSVTVF